MSYEVVNEMKHICPCGKGVIQYVCELTFNTNKLQNKIKREK